MNDPSVTELVQRALATTEEMQRLAEKTRALVQQGRAHSVRLAETDAQIWEEISKK